jgi:hypothetical protein
MVRLEITQLMAVVAVVQVGHLEELLALGQH